MASPPFPIDIEILRTDDTRYGSEWSGLRLNDAYNRLYVVIEGEAEVEVNDEILVLEQGCSYLFPHTIRFAYRCSTYFWLLNVCFEMRGQSHIDLLSVQPYRRQVRPLDMQLVTEKMRKIRATSEKLTFAARLEASGNLLQLLAAHFTDDGAETLVNKKRDLQRLKPSLEYIHANIEKKLLIGDLCSMANMSRQYYSKIFKETLYTSPQAYVRYERINRAKKMLRNSRTKIATISDDLGYASPAYFTREFKALTGTVPKIFRQDLQLI